MSAARAQATSAGPIPLTAARSALYRRLAEALSFPSPGLAGAVAAGRFLAELKAELQPLHFLPPLDGDAEAACSDPTLTLEEMETEYIRLFEVGPGRPPCPLYEGSHRGGRMKMMEELVRFYDYFGLRALTGDQPDHLCAELEFMHYLAFREAAAPGRAKVSYSLAQRDFLERHLCRWLPRLRLRLQTCQPLLFYGSLVALAADTCSRDLVLLKDVGQNPTDKSGLA